MKRFRKYRVNQIIRDKFAEIKLYKDNLICPFFVVDGKKVKTQIKNFYDVYHFSIDMLLKEIEVLYKNGVNKILLFGVIDKKYKNTMGTTAYSEKKENIVLRAIKKIKQNFPEILIFSDICLCGYTSHGHCGIVKKDIIDNDITIKYLAKMALLHAKYGVDFVAPSAMMDGQVGAIRKELDNNGFKKVKILAYSAKYASNFYGPFREAANSVPAFGDRKTYQMDFRNIKQAIEEIKEDIKEGADIVMVKPANLYLDVIYAAKQTFPDIKLAAYQVSGEYLMLKLLVKKGLADERQCFIESLTAIKRAGADLIISYYSMEIAKCLNY